MASKCMIIVVLVALVGVQTTAAADPDISKMQGTRKVLSMLQKLSDQVDANRKTESEAYSKYSAWCESTMKDKSDSIKSGTQAVALAQGQKEKKENAKTEHETDVETFRNDITNFESDKEKLVKDDTNAAHVFQLNDADLSGAINGVTGAVKTLQGESKKGHTSLLQMSDDMKQTILKFASQADALGFVSGDAVNALLQTETSGAGFLQQPEQVVDAYKFQGGKILKVLEKLQKDFQDEHDTLLKNRKDAKESFTKEKSNVEKSIEKANTNIAESTKKINKLAAEIATLTTDLTGLAAQVKDDEDYLKEIKAVADDKEQANEKRQKNFKDESHAIMKGIEAIVGVAGQRNHEDYKIRKGLAGVKHHEDYKFRHLMLQQTAEGMVHNEAALEAVEAAVEEEEQEASAAPSRSLSLIQDHHRHHVTHPNHYFESLEPTLSQPESQPDDWITGSLSAAESQPDDGRQAVMKMYQVTHPNHYFESLEPTLSQPGSQPDDWITGSLGAAESQPDHGRQAVMKMLKTEGVALHSAVLTSLSLKIAADPMAKIKTLVTELIDRLTAQAAAESEHKGFCDKAIGDATRERDLQQKDITSSANEEAALKARLDGLQLDVLTGMNEVNKLMDDQKTRDMQRASEKKQNADLVEDGAQSRDAVKLAVKELQKFYKDAAKKDKAVQQAKLDNKLNKETSIEKNMKKSKFQSDAPSSGFDGTDEYNGNQGAANGIFGLLQVLQSDFEYTVSETGRQEAKAVEDYEKLKKEATISINEKNILKQQKGGQMNDCMDAYYAARTKKFAAEANLKLKNTELSELQPVCAPRQTHKEREAARQGEIKSLRSALELLEDAYGK